ncbi:MAG TPA: LuxR C-terminal-related transcriptional regulator [Solirubrobacteraceae bacterium]|nr:LuxR C-terminal-related transcriptional regulator [Solirubrobacteraceae bacterium]
MPLGLTLRHADVLRLVAMGHSDSDAAAVLGIEVPTVHKHLQHCYRKLGGGPTDDNPAVTLEAPRDPDRVSSFLNIRVKDIQTVYADWGARGAQFLTPPKQHQYEIRCYIRDPDGHLIEVGQTTDTDGDWTPAHWPSSTPGAEAE